MADAEGTWVALTQTINTTFGSMVIVPGLGVLMNNEMDDFSVALGVANAFGLLGSEANEVAPGKRPLSSMSPTIELQHGKPLMSVGAAGGPKIISQTLLMLLRRIDLNLPLAEAVASPRLHHQWRPDQTVITHSLGPAIQATLAQMGHVLSEVNSLAVVQAIEQNADGAFQGVHDPSVPGKAAGR
jgi:gamma-glutamyltranspeptidase / glutathione hydrolase